MKSTLRDIQNIKTHFVSEGTGNRTMIFLHGWGGSVESFRSLATKISRQLNLKCIILDLPGFGQSSNPPSTGWFIADYEKWIAEFIQTQKIEKPLFYGHSFGCRIIIDYLLKHPHHAEKVILTGAAGIKWPPTFRERTSKFLSKKLAFVKPYIPKKAYTLFLRKILKAHDWADVSESLKKTFQNTIEEPDFRDRLPEIQNEILLLWGRNDSYTPIKSGYVFDQKLPHATLHVFDDGRHGIHYSHEDQIISLLKNFLEGDILST
jgi:2-hydroxy-6-oxonona-2,4-dienedioate hydrolase